MLVSMLMAGERPFGFGLPEEKGISRNPDTRTSRPTRGRRCRRRTRRVRAAIRRSYHPSSRMRRNSAPRTSPWNCLRAPRELFGPVVDGSSTQPVSQPEVRSTNPSEQAATTTSPSAATINGRTPARASSRRSKFRPTPAKQSRNAHFDRLPRLVIAGLCCCRGVVHRQPGPQAVLRVGQRQGAADRGETRTGSTAPRARMAGDRIAGVLVVGVDRAPARDDRRDPADRGADRRAASISFAAEPERAARASRYHRGGHGHVDEDQPRLKPPSLARSPSRNRAPSSTIPIFSQNS